MKGCELEVCHVVGKTDHLSGLKLRFTTCISQRSFFALCCCCLQLDFFSHKSEYRTLLNLCCAVCVYVPLCVCVCVCVRDVSVCVY